MTSAKELTASSFIAVIAFARRTTKQGRLQPPLVFSTTALLKGNAIHFQPVVAGLNSPSSNLACDAANRAIGTRGAEQDT